MNRLHAHILTGGLLLSPLLIAASELARLTVDNHYVEHENDEVADAASHLQAVADRLTLWHTAGLLELAYAAAWGVALLAVAIVVGRSRPVLGAASGLLGLASMTGIVMHTTFYYAPLAALAQEPDRDLASRAAALGGDDLLVVVGLVLFLIGTLLTVLVAGFGLWRAHALPWWGAAGLVIWFGYVVTGPEARLGALLNLALLLPFVAVARELRAERRTVPSHEVVGV
jgi:hypothetical protein